MHGFAFDVHDDMVGKERLEKDEMGVFRRSD
jgi:hypothetical protein